MYFFLKLITKFIQKPNLRIFVASFYYTETNFLHNEVPATSSRLRRRQRSCPLVCSKPASKTLRFAKIYGLQQALAIFIGPFFWIWIILKFCLQNNLQRSLLNYFAK